MNPAWCVVFGKGGMSVFGFSKDEFEKRKVRWTPYPDSPYGTVVVNDRHQLTLENTSVGVVDLLEIEVYELRSL